MSIQRWLLETEETETGCLEWSGRRDPDGYGRISFRGKDVAVHRKLFELLHDTHLSPHEYVCHSCDNPPCINPEHLWLGDSRANQLDSVAKGRHKSQGGVRTAEKARRR